VDFSDYFPASKRDLAEMAAELTAAIEGIGNPHLLALLRAVFNDPAIARLFQIAPAAKMIHHAFLSGLLEHVLSMSALARAAADHYRYVDRDLLLTGVLLHDLGKIHELTYDRSFGYSDEGQLVGHIAIGLRILHEKLVGLPDFPPKLRALVEHLVLSHHGQLEFGSPRVPLFPEAMLLHQLDNLDSKMETMRGLLERDRLVDGCWTGYSSALERAVLKKDRYLSDDQPGANAIHQPAPAAPAKQPPKPQGNSLFGSKLAEALKK
jgi:3'-5' exoribonuclease